MNKYWLKEQDNLSIEYANRENMITVKHLLEKKRKNKIVEVDKNKRIS